MESYTKHERAFPSKAKGLSLVMVALLLLLASYLAKLKSYFGKHWIQLLFDQEFHAIAT
jgi:hypothetical protein